MPHPPHIPFVVTSYAGAARRGLQAQLLAQQAKRAANAHRVLSNLKQRAAKRKASPAPARSSDTDNAATGEAAAEHEEETQAKRVKTENGTGDVVRQPELADGADSNCASQQMPATASAAQMHAAPDVLVTSAQEYASLVEARIREIHHTAMMFAKNQPHLRFQASGSSFMQFRMQFEAFLEQLQCEHVLSSKPGDAVPGVPANLLAAQQSNVYYMLTIAAPKEAQAGLRTACPRTAYDAWKLLRDRFLGEEAAYKQQLLLQFAGLCWMPKEPFTTFDARFTSLIAELELIAGEEKSTEDKQAAILRAIQTRDGPHRDADYMRMRNVSNALTYAAVGAGRSVPFETWLSHMRDEARAIEDQRTQHNSHRQLQHGTAHVSSALPAQLNAVTMSNGVGKQLCRLWQHSGGQSCRFGNSCKFAHSAVQQSAPAGPSPLPCRDWRQGRCSRGDTCRFSHGGATGQGRMGPQTGVQANSMQLHSHPQQQEAAQTESTSLADRQYLLVNAEGPQQSRSTLSVSRQQLCILDSGAGGSMTPRRELFEQLQPLDTPVWLTGALSGQSACATMGGTAVIPLGAFDLRLDHVVLCEQLQHTLLSMVQLRKLGYTITLGDDSGELVDPSGLHRVPLSYSGNVTSLVVEWGVDTQQQPEAPAAVLPVNAMTRSQRAQLTQLASPIPEDEPTASPASETTPAQAASPAPPQAVSTDEEPAPTAPLSAVSSSVALAHARYGHLGERKLQQLVQHAAVDSLLLNARELTGVQALVSKCDSCQLAKQPRRPFGDAIDHQVSAANDMATADLCGPITVRTSSTDATPVKVYSSVIVDVFTRHPDVRLLQSKREASDHVVSYWHRANTLTGQQLKRLHTDGGREYNKAEYTLTARGTAHTRTPVHTSNWNAIVERKHRSLLDVTSALLQHALHVPGSSSSAPLNQLIDVLLLREAMGTAVLLHAQLTMPQGHKHTQHELWTKQRPDVGWLRVWGCDAMVHIPDAEREGRLHARAGPATFIGYDLRHHHCWRFLCGDRIVVSRDATFKEHSFTLLRARVAAAATSSTDVSSGDSVGLQVDPEQPMDEQSSSESENESESGDRVDRRTARLIAAAERREQQRLPVTDASATVSTRLPRVRNAARQSGVNLDDFGVALAVQLQEPAMSAPSAGGQLHRSDVSV